MDTGINFCGKSNIPVGARVMVIQNLEGNVCEPFIHKTGTATHPFRRGCRDAEWIGINFDEATIYGKQFNFHVSEIKIINNPCGNQLDGIQNVKIL